MSTVNGTVLFTLPVGYIPSTTLYFIAHNGDGLNSVGINIDNAGNVKISDSTANNSILSLNGISFRAEV